MNFTRISNLRTRLIQIIDSVLVRFEDCSDTLFGLDQSKLEEWMYVLRQAIVEKEKIIEPIKREMSTSQKTKKIVLPRIPAPDVNLPKQMTSQGHIEMRSNKLVEIVNGNTITIHSLKDSKYNTKNATQFNQLTLNFPGDSIKRFCSVVQVAKNKYIFAGGCLFSNPRIKSNSISLFDSELGTFRKIGELIDPLSSHGCVYVQSKVYFIGGKKNEGVITKMCSYYHMHQQQTVEIAALNYGCASMSVTHFQGTYIYKAGGIGECFGEFSLSPYIQRYNIKEDYWEVINPCISPNLINQFGCFQLFAHSLMYTAGNQLVIVGGFDLSKKGTNFGAVIKVKDTKQVQQNQNQNEGLETQHEIISFGSVQGLQAGGFWTNQIIIQPFLGEIMTMQTSFNPSLTTKLIKIPHSRSDKSSK